MPDKLKNLRKNIISNLIQNGISRQETLVEVDLLINHVFGLEKKDLILQPDLELPQEKIEIFNSLVDRRVREKIPVQYLTNRAYFMGYEFYVDTNVLIPRPETEILVQRVLDLASNTDFNSIDNKYNQANGASYNLTIADIGTGSGCIACMLAKKLDNVKIIASDISEKALEVAKINAKKLQVQDKIEFRISDIFQNIEEKVDIIVSNPPYIPISERENLQHEVVQHEPHLALFAYDEKGIEFYKRLIEESKLKLNESGYISFEIGISQASDITGILQENDFDSIEVVRDYNNIERIIIAKLSYHCERSEAISE